MNGDIKGPSNFEIKNFIQNQSWIEFNTINDKVLKGQIVWFDGDIYHLKLENGSEISLLKQSVVYYNKSM